MLDWLKAFYEFFGSKHPTISLWAVMLIGAIASGIAWQFLRHLYLKGEQAASSLSSVDGQNSVRSAAPRLDFKISAIGQLLLDRRNELVAALLPHEGRVVGIATANRAHESDRVARRRLVQDFTEIFKEAGWRPYSHEIAPPMEDYSGIVLVSYKGNQPPSNPDFEPIKAALDSQGMSYRMMRLPWMGLYISPRDGEGVTTSDPVLYIGSLE